jgi:ketosteroid isomerase-like protein
MDEHANVDLIRRAVDAFSTGNVDVLPKLLSPDIVVHSPGTSVLAGDYRGLDAIAAYNERIFELSRGTYENQIHDIIANDDHGIVLQRNTATREDRALDVNEALVMHIRDGRIAEVWELYADQAAYDAFWND